MKHGILWPPLIFGRLYRWYLAKARHPFRDKVLGKFWGFLSSIKVWVPYVDGLIIKVGARDYIQQKILLDGVYEPLLIDWIRKNLDERDIFWDVGANIGSVTLISAIHCREVVAFEPDTRLSKRLHDNIRANQIKNVQVLNIALSDCAGETSLYLGPENNSGMNSMLAIPGSTQIQIKTNTIDQLTEKNSLPFPTVMKVDVEGAEFLVFSGAKKTLDKNQLRTIIFESKEGPGQLPENYKIVEILKDAGFKINLFGRSDPETTDTVNNYIATR